MPWKVDFIGQLEMTSSVVGARSFKTLPKAKLAPKKGHGLMVCCWFDPLQLSESRRNHYIWNVCSANQWDASKTAISAASMGQPNGPNSSPGQCLIVSHTIKPSKVEQIDLRSFASSAMFSWPLAKPTITCSSISAIFFRENSSTNSRRQKMLSKSSSNLAA